MAIIDVVKWDAAPGVFAWKFPSSELSSWTQLIVSESQEALMLKEGRAVGPFTAGRHVLSSDNYPVLHTLLKIPFGRSPYTAEVWFVQKAFKLDIRWGTSSPMQVEDPRFHIMLPLRAFGQYGVTVVDTARFLVKLVGTLPVFTETTLQDYFRGIVVTKAKDCIATYLLQNRVSVVDVNAHLNEISELLQGEVAQVMAEYGLQLAHFTVNGISTDENDEGVQKLKKALAERAEMEILGTDYRQKRSFDTLEAAAGNPGAGGVAMGAGVGLGMGIGMAAPLGGVAGQLAQNLNLGNDSLACPSCRAMNPAGARFCNQCGQSLVAQDPRCPKCNAPLPAGSRFCSTCGTPLAT